jgi:superfamily II DNA or RNA helicase
METAPFVKFLRDHLNVWLMAVLCDRVGLHVPTNSGAAAAAALRKWLKDNPVERARDLLGRVDDRTLFEWGREVGEPSRNRKKVIDSLMKRLGEPRPVGIPRDDDDLDDVAVDDDVGFFFDPKRARKWLRPYQTKCLAELEGATQGGGPGKHLIEIATGGGKTRVANDWVWRRAKRGKRILWITKDWELLRQAADDLCGRHKGAAGKAGYVGPKGHLPQLEANASARVVYTTIHTWTAREASDFRDQRFDFVVIDELHWGEGGASYSRLLRRYRRRTIVGLTATPREWTSFVPVGEPCDFPFLVRRRYLARPMVGAPRETGVRWRPRLNGTHGDFAEASLTELAANADRNRFIVDTYLQDRDRFGKTLVFACNIDHAERLADLFKTAKLSAEVLHSQMDAEERRMTRRRFRDNRTQILINVAMLTHGVDIPDIETVFMARPTASRTLFMQMVGRGSRRTPTKKSFFIIDFVDAVERHSDVNLSAIQILGKDFPPLLDAAKTTSLARPRARVSGRN